jgi:hypothetical protein
MRYTAGILAIVLCAFFSGTSFARGGYWSGSGQPLNITNDVAEWDAPGGWARIRVSDDTSTLKMGKTVFEIGGIYANPLLSEVAWSEDIKGVFVNASDGGDTGTWGTLAFIETNGKAREIPVSKLIKTKHALKSDCKYLNIASVAWIDAGSELLVLEQVPNSSGCSNMNKAVVHVIDVKHNKIREVLAPAKARARYSDVFGARTAGTLSKEPNK